MRRPRPVRSVRTGPGGTLSQSARPALEGRAWGLTPSGSRLVEGDDRAVRLRGFPPGGSGLRRPMPFGSRSRAAGGRSAGLWRTDSAAVAKSPRRERSGIVATHTRGPVTPGTRSPAAPTPHPRRSSLSQTSRAFARRDASCCATPSTHKGTAWQRCGSRTPCLSRVSPLTGPHRAATSRGEEHDPSEFRRMSPLA